MEFMAVRLARQETRMPPGHLVSTLVCRDPWMSTVVLYSWCSSDSASVLLYFTHLNLFEVLNSFVINCYSAICCNINSFRCRERLIRMLNISWECSEKNLIFYCNTPFKNNLASILKTFFVPDQKPTPHLHKYQMNRAWEAVTIRHMNCRV